MALHRQGPQPRASLQLLRNRGHTLTPAEFIAKWHASPKREHIDSQPHFLDLCRLLGIDDPATADPGHAWFTFEKGAAKSTGGQGWADVWRKACFGWEYKSFGRPLDPAFDQL